MILSSLPSYYALELITGKNRINAPRVELHRPLPQGPQVGARAAGFASMTASAITSLEMEPKPCVFAFLTGLPATPKLASIYSVEILGLAIDLLAFARRTNRCVRGPLSDLLKYCIHCCSKLARFYSAGQAPACLPAAIPFILTLPIIGRRMATSDS